MVIRNTDMGVILQDKNNKEIEKVVFFILYPSGNFDIVKTKLIRAIDSFDATRFDIPEGNNIDARIASITKALNENEKILVETKSFIIDNLTALRKVPGPKGSGGLCSYIEEQRLYIVREKALYTTMNLLHYGQRYLQGNVWIPEELGTKIQGELTNISNRPNMPVSQIQ